MSQKIILLTTSLLETQICMVHNIRFDCKKMMQNYTSKRELRYKNWPQQTNDQDAMRHDSTIYYIYADTWYTLRYPEK